MKRTAILSIIFLICISVFGQVTTSKLDSMLTLKTAQHSFNGTVLVAQNGKIILEKGYGFKNKKENLLNTANTSYQIGSITKQFTSAIILQLVAAKKMTLQDKLSKYFRGYPGGDSITVEQLLTHTSGIYNYTNDGNFMRDRSEHPIARDSLLALFEYKPLDFSPGTKWSYSNSGYILLGMIIEKITGKSYFKVVRENIFKPLGMSHSGFDFTHLKNADKATGYGGDLTVPVGIVDSSVSFAAGAIYTTVGDLYKWDRALYTNQIVDQALLQKAFTIYQSSYGYGWMIIDSYGKKTVQHGGGITGFASYILRVPGDQTCIIVLTNIASDAPSKISNEINGMFNGKTVDLSAERKEIVVDTQRLKRYVGEYELAPTFHIFITLENGLLQAQATGQGKNTLFAEKDNFFFLKTVDAQVEFITSAEGKTDHLVLYQNGQKMTAKKLGLDELSPTPPVRKEISVDINTLNKYIGEYELVPAFHIVITLENGALQAQATGQPKFAMYAEKTNFFFFKVVDAQIEFLSGPSEKTDHLILYQNGQQTEGKKIR
jgi:CubicO group peptidase (beta-lactamase class C family)